MSDKADNATEKAPKKSKKMLFIIVGAVVAIAAAGGGFVIMQNKKAAEADSDAPAAHEAKTPPTFMPLENMVVNLADPAGDRYVQIGITLEVTDAHAIDTLKAFMPSIRNGILLAVSKHTAVELLGAEGKEQLAADIKAEVSKPLGFDESEHEAEAEVEKPKAGKNAKAKPKKKGPVNPVQRVLFSSFIVQ